VDYDLSLLSNLSLWSKIALFVFVMTPFCTLTGRLFDGFAPTAKEGKTLPNEGVRLTLKNACGVFLATVLIIGVLTMVAGALLFALRVPPAFGVVFGLLGLLAAVVLGVIAWGLHGGFAVVGHYAVRMTLWLSGNMPFNCVKFLDHCSKLTLLKKVGGGYSFMHPMIRDYFAEISPQFTKAEDGQRGQSGP
jgi:hypothetical protein